MPRWQGSENRKPKDSVKSLQELVVSSKEERAIQGCELCHGWSRVTDPKRLLWCHRNQEEKNFTPTHAPCMAGMTREKLLAEIEKCMLVCKRCFHRYRQHVNISRPLMSLTDRATDLSIFLGPELTDALVEQAPEALKLGDSLFVRARQPATH